MPKFFMPTFLGLRDVVSIVVSPFTWSKNDKNPAKSDEQTEKSDEKLVVTSNKEESKMQHFILAVTNLLFALPRAILFTFSGVDLQKSELSKPDETVLRNSNEVVSGDSHMAQSSTPIEHDEKAPVSPAQSRSSSVGSGSHADVELERRQAAEYPIGRWVWNHKSALELFYFKSAGSRS